MVLALRGREGVIWAKSLTAWASSFLAGNVANVVTGGRMGRNCSSTGHHEPKTSHCLTQKGPWTKSGPQRPPAPGLSLPTRPPEVIRSDRCISHEHAAKCGRVL